MERTLRIESLVHGGDGLARDGGQVVFVPLTAPGDLVRVEVETARSGAARGRVLEVVERGTTRVEPPCPVVGSCGGCQWQQVDLDEQQRAKEQNVAAALTRIGRWKEALPLRPLVASPRPWRYRRRLRAHLTSEGWGFSKRSSHELVPIASCLLVEPEAELLAHALAGALHAWDRVRSFSVDSVGSTGAARFKGTAHIELAQPPTDSHRKRAMKLLASIPRLQGLVLTGEDGVAPMLVGEPVLIDRDHRSLRIRPDLFAQANRLGARLLAEATAETIEPGASVLEIFAGAGTLSLAIVERAGSLVATEGNGPALELLRASLRDRKKTARLIAGGADKVVGGLAQEGHHFDHVVLDPPRTGAKDVITSIEKLRPRSITYVSCDAPTFARDAALLAQAGWSLEAVTPFDMFPHTHHVELLAVLRRR